MALGASDSILAQYAILFVEILPHITTLAISCIRFDPADLFPKNRKLANLRHLFLDIRSNDASSLFGHGRLDLASLHLTNRSIEEDEEVVSRLVKIAKGEDPMHKIERVIVYRSREELEIEHGGLVDDLDIFEWRKDTEYPTFDDFDGR